MFLPLEYLQFTRLELWHVSLNMKAFGWAWISFLVRQMFTLWICNRKPIQCLISTKLMMWSNFRCFVSYRNFYIYYLENGMMISNWILDANGSWTLIHWQHKVFQFIISLLVVRGQESKRKMETHQLYFVFLFYTFLFLNVSLVLKQTPVFSLCCMVKGQFHPSPKAAPFPDPCFCVSVVSQVSCTALEHLLNHTDCAGLNASGMERQEEKFSSSQ